MGKKSNNWVRRTQVVAQLSHNTNICEFGWKHFCHRRYHQNEWWARFDSTHVWVLNMKLKSCARNLLKIAVFTYLSSENRIEKNNRINAGAKKENHVSLGIIVFISFLKNFGWNWIVKDMCRIYVLLAVKTIFCNLFCWRNHFFPLIWLIFTVVHNMTLE